VNRLDTIDALRGLAAVAVLLYHSREVLWIGIRETYNQYGFGLNLNGWLGYATIPFNYGYLGVTLFFILSGYCIHRRGAKTLTAPEEKDRDLNWWTFAKRRFIRIYPTYVAALIFAATVDYWLLDRSLAQSTTIDLSWPTFFINLISLQGYLAPQYSSNGVFWTLAIEMHLYAAYPILFYLSKRFGPEAVLCITFITSLTYGLLDSFIGLDAGFVFRSIRGPVFLPYWFTWALGFYIAEIEAKRTSVRWSQNWLKIVVASIFTSILIGFFKATLVSEIFASIALACIFERLLRVKSFGVATTYAITALAWIGTFSYTLYAFHSPMLKIADAIIGHRFVSIIPVFFVSAIIVICSWLMFFAIERWSIIQSLNVNSNQPKAHAI